MNAAEKRSHHVKCPKNGYGCIVGRTGIGSAANTSMKSGMNTLRKIMSEHYQYSYNRWKTDVFGCGHTDQETDVSVIPDYCLFCGVSLGSEDIDVIDWSGETATASRLGRQS